MGNKDALSRVRCFLLDMDGTFYLGEQLLEGALRFIDVLNQQGREFLFLTNNSSRDSGQYAEKIARLGLSISREKVLTSGEATAMHIQSQMPEAGMPIRSAAFSTNNGFGLPTIKSGSRPVEVLTKAIVAPISGMKPVSVGQL